MRSLSKSQLRRLAAEYADGHIAAGEYRDRRRELIDAIVEGQVPIQREDAALRAKAEPRSHPAGPTPSAPRWLLILGGAAAVLLAMLLWLLWPADEAPPPPATAVVPPAVEIPRSRALVESFLALRDFSAPSVAAFRAEWDALAESERAQARDTLWFRSLVRALRDEIKTQKALAGIAGGGAALQRAQQVRAFGAYLGVAEQLPGIEIVLPGGGAGAAQSPAQRPLPAPGTQDAPAPGAGSTAEATQPLPGATTDIAPTGREWLAAQADDALTLQLFAVSHLDRVERLMAAHPDLALHIVASDAGRPRYRVLHGVYPSEAAARAGFDALPAAVSAAAGGAIVKSFTALRDDLAGAATPEVTGEGAAGHITRHDYTLQLFASRNLTNALALVNAFPELSLDLHQIDGDTSPYRVVFGRFGSADDARAATSVLPGNLLSRIGTPLPKTLDEIGTKIR
jgi:septal ring-binding cell division protein DamX